MGKVVINRCYGGFGLSKKAQTLLKMDTIYPEIDRHDPNLVRVVEQLGGDASGDYAALVVEEFEGDLYRIEEYDGMEWLETPDTIEWTRIE